MLFTAILERLSHNAWIDYESLTHDFSISESMLKATLLQLCQMGYLATTPTLASSTLPHPPQCKSCPFAKKCSSMPSAPAYHLTEKGLHYIHRKSII